MKISDIRLDADPNYSWSLHGQDQQKILKKKKHFVHIACPACDKESGTFFFERDGFYFERCCFCETVYVNPRPTLGMLIEYYRTSINQKHFFSNIYPKTEHNRVKHLIEPRVREIYHFCEEHDIDYGTIVDVGGGCGTFCEITQRDGRFEESIVVEPDPDSANICREKGITVVEDFVENMRGTAVADVITSFENIEHVFNPRMFLLKLYDILKREGLLVVTTPNIKGFDLLTLKDKSENVIAPAHLNYFHPQSIRLLLESCNFKVLEVKTPGKLDAELVRNKVIEGDLTLDNQPFLRQILIEEHQQYMESFQEWLADKGLSSHMWVIARKR